MSDVRIAGYLPDLPNDPRHIVASSGIVPTERGIGNGGVFRLNPSSLPFTGNVLNGASLTQLDGSTAVIYGTPTKLYSEGHDDLSSAVYSASAAHTWSFAQFGGIMFAVNKSNNLQQRNTASAPTFTTIAGAPKASIVTAPGTPGGQFIVLLDYDDGVNNYVDGVYWSALSNHLSWTPSIATQCGNFRITDIGGKLTAGIPYHDGLLLWKRRGMYYGQHTGPPLLWSFQRIANDVGCIGKNAVVEADGVIYFADRAGLWMYDGSAPRPVPDGPHRQWSRAFDATLLTEISFNFVRLMWDKTRHLVWFMYGDDNTGGLMREAFTFHTRTGMWTQHGPILAPEFGNAPIAFPVSPATAVQSGATPNPGRLVWDGSAGPASTFRMGAIGDEVNKVTLGNLRPAWLVGPPAATTAWASSIWFHSPLLREPLTHSYVPVFSLPGRFDGEISDSYISPQISVAANTAWELASMDYDTTAAGKA